MGTLDTASRLPDPDLAYRALIEAHRGLSEEESAALNTRLVLILANQVGDPEVLAQAIALARRCHPGPASMGTDCTYGDAKPEVSSPGLTR